ncbi:hypothetical protein O181_006749 [Austropuccinia psidii MF-1]|uniref:Uncharacterized protein n=1 Tax=Austropuccinia psidii MF-1 TaxID=1389203 RepID=A0A9Q3GH69_9BASI|nr:hypothetical protein [Austropuccinia psidii MF-1]
MQLDSEVELIAEKGKERAKSTQGSALSQRQVPEMPIISEPELELSISHSNGYRSHSEASNRHLHEPVHEILQWIESTIIQDSNQKDKVVPCQKEGGEQGRSASSFKQQASSQPTSPRREEEKEKELEETIFPKPQDSKNSKRCHGQFLQHGQNLDAIQGQRRTKNETTSFSLKITLSPDVVNPLTEIKNSILPLKRIKNS